MHIDSLIGMRSKGRELGDWEDGGIKGDGIVFSHRAPLLKTQGLLNLKRSYFAPDRLSVSSRFGEPTVMHREINAPGLCELGMGFWLGPVSIRSPSGPERFPTAVRSSPWPGASQLILNPPAFTGHSCRAADKTLEPLRIHSGDSSRKHQGELAGPH